MMRREARFDVLGRLTALRRYARSVTRHDVDAEDLGHDALVRADKKPATFHIGGNLKAWPLSILYNVYVDGSRARDAVGAMPRACRRIGGPASSTRAGAPSAPSPSSADVPRVTPARRSDLVAIEGLTDAATAATFGILVDTLTSRIARARDALRAIEANDSMASTATARHVI